MDVVKIYTLQEAGILGLIQQTLWLPECNEEFSWLKIERNRINNDRNRTAIIVCHNHKLALFVNEVE
mgnify:CR=1 FL=1